MQPQESHMLTSNHFENFTHSGEEVGQYPEPQTAPAPALAPAKAASSARSRCGRKRFGFYPGEPATIQRLLELRAQGMGFDRIAELMNRQSVPTRSGKPWHGRVVNRILKAESATI